MKNSIRKFVMPLAAILVLLMMVGEAVALVPPLLGMYLLSQRILPAAPTLAAGGGGNMGLLPSMLAGTGAGIYEEFLFRLVGLNLITLLLVDVFELPKGLCCAFGVCVCSDSTAGSTR